MAPLFGSCRALLGQAGERTPLLLSELPFRDAKYDPIEPPHLLLLPIQVASLPMHKSLRYEVESLNSAVLIPPPTHHQLWWKKKKKRKKFASDPVTPAKPERCASLQTPLLSPLLRQTLC